MGWYVSSTFPFCYFSIMIIFLYYPILLYYIRTMHDNAECKIICIQFTDD